MTEPNPAALPAAEADTRRTDSVDDCFRFSLEQDQSNSVVAFAILAAEDMARQQIGSECRDAEEVLTARSSELGLMDVCAREETARQGLQRDWEAGAGDLQDRAGQLKLLLIEEEECADRSCGACGCGPPMWSH